MSQKAFLKTGLYGSTSMYITINNTLYVLAACHNFSPYTVSCVKLAGGFLTLGWAKLSLLPFLIEDSISYQMFFMESINKLYSQSYSIFNLLKYMYYYIMNLYLDCDLLKMLNFSTKNDTPTFFSQMFETW